MRIVLVVFALLASGPALAVDRNAEDLFDGGLAAAEAQLTARPLETSADRFLLGATRFLGGVEAALHARWRLGVAEQVGPFPLLRLNLAPNPEPEAFDPAFVETIFADLLVAMQAAREPLAEIGDGDDFTVRVDLARIWLDINGSGARDSGEGVIEIAASGFGFRPQGAEVTPEELAPDIVDFDTADAAWLHAYADVLSGFGELVLAFRPTEAIARVMAAEQRIAEMASGRTGQAGLGIPDDWIVRPAVYVRAIQVRPDAGRLEAMRGHMWRMTEQNRVFWRRVDMETDDSAEWIPHDRQTGAMGVEFPDGAGAAWLEVLADAERVLEGELLIPFWRIDADFGINLKRVIEEPPVIDIAGWLHGADALPFIEEGARISADSWMRFQELARGRGLLFALVLN